MRRLQNLSQCDRALTEDSQRIVPQDEGQSGYLFPTSASFQSTQQAQESALASTRCVLCSHAADESTARGPETASAAARSVGNTGLEIRNMLKVVILVVMFLQLF